ncbi:MAG: IS66 family insertion sequence element accessory protein TnpA [Candidatus Azotimanducaceae bacterium WSBS_2022_MAG_OTU7]
MFLLDYRRIVMTTSTPATSVLATSQPEPGRKASTRVMRTRDQWKALLEEFADSRLTRSAFCKTHQIATSSLYRCWPILRRQSQPGHLTASGKSSWRCAGIVLRPRTS